MKSRPFLLAGVLVLLSCLAMSAGCVGAAKGASPWETPTWIERVFPSDPDDVFFDDEARGINERLSSTRPNVDM